MRLDYPALMAMPIGYSITPKEKLEIANTLLKNWKRNATSDVQRIIVLEAVEEVSKAIAHLL